MAENVIQKLDETAIRAHLRLLYSGLRDVRKALDQLAKGLESVRTQVLSSGTTIPAHIRKTVEDLDEALLGAQATDLLLGAIQSNVDALQEPKAQR